MVPINRNRSIYAKRNYFLLKPTCSWTTHKSQEGTFVESVYKYSLAHSQPLVYLALYIGTAEEGLPIVHTDGCQETWLRNEELGKIENFKRITQHRRDFVRRNTQYVNQTKSNLGDTCATRCTLPDGKPIVVVTVCISFNQSVLDIIDYIHETLLVHTEGDSKLLGK
ncbi:hypothetical protein TNCV_4419891 [Trichonephila clavipes]|nr:hypothetical protein TNCV_4419891 [Trichonephila clavipes]